MCGVLGTQEVLLEHVQQIADQNTASVIVSELHRTQRVRLLTTSG
jgi:hypothetical protein